METTTQTHTVVDSPLGELTLVAENGALSGVYFARHRRGPDPASFGRRDDAGFAEPVRQLTEYFARERTEFDLPLAPHGDAFDRRVWELLSAIPYGQTRTYADVARQLGNAALAQAVGAANARNPLCVIVPCHRVIGSDGSLTGYAGGLARKRFLLQLEEPPATTSERLF
jgi:methylated-DNA-[protein]-cysteine S-methyltransferase